MSKFNYKKIAYIVLVVFCLTPFTSSPISLLIGIIFAVLLGNPFENLTHKYIHILLQISIVGLGFGLNISEALQAGKSGLLLTVISIISVLVFGYTIGKILKIENKLMYLITVGTAICGVVQ